MAIRTAAAAAATAAARAGLPSLPTTMTAVRHHQTGGPDVLTMETVPVPAPGAGDVLIALEAVGVNFIEVYRREGLYKVPLPHVPGSEGAGVVVAVGAGVTQLAVGDRVVSSALNGAYAQYATAAAAQTAKVPPAVATSTAAAVFLQGLTAHYLTHTTFALAPGHTCVVHAAAGGTGLLLVQLAKRRGARVIGTVSTEAKAQLARAAGADEVIVYGTADDGANSFDAEVRRLTAARGGADVVYDSVGRATFDRSLQCLRPRGHLVCFGAASGQVAPLDIARLTAGSFTVTRPTLVHYIADPDEFAWRSAELFDLVQSGALNVRIGLQLPLRQAADAHTALQSRGTTGKIILLVDGHDDTAAVV